MFLTSHISYQSAKIKYDAKAYEQDLITRQLNVATEQIDQIESLGLSKAELQKSKYYSEYQDLEAQETAYQLKSDNIASEMEVLKQDMDAFKADRKEGLKDAGSFWSFE